MNLELKRRIEKIALECAKSGWDGYEANAVTGTAVADAYAFAEKIDTSLLIPEVGSEPDGVLTFEWYRSARQTLSVSVHGSGVLHYAALLGAAKAHGTEPFVAKVPKVISDLIDRVTNEEKW